MLKMDEIKIIKYLYEKQGKSLRKISLETGHAFETVKKYVELTDFNNPVRLKAVRETKLDDFKQTINQWLESDLSLPRKQRHTAKRVYKRLLNTFGDDFTASYRTVANYVKKYHRKLGHLKHKAYLPLSHRPGEAQIDFGTAKFIEKGKEFTGKYLIITFPYSNCGYCQIFRGENQECFLEGLKRFFEYMGLIPSEIWFDNLSAAVVSIGKGGERQLTEKFEKFVLHYDFEAKFCNAYSGNEKGNVENKVGYQRRNYFVPIPEFNSLEEYNKKLFLSCENDMEREHYAKKISIKTLFQEDIKRMKKLNSKPFEISKLVKAKTDKYGLLKFNNNTYSSSPNYVLSELWMKISYNKVTVLNDDFEEIISHKRLYGKDLKSMKWVPYLSLMSKRPTAIKYTSFYDDLPQNWRHYLDELDYTEKKEALIILREILLKHDLKLAEKVLEINQEKGVKDTKSLKVTFRQLIDDKRNMPSVSLPDTVPHLDPYEVKLELYNKLIKGLLIFMFLILFRGERL